MTNVERCGVLAEADSSALRSGLFISSDSMIKLTGLDVRSSPTPHMVEQYRDEFHQTRTSHLSCRNPLPLMFVTYSVTAHGRRPFA